MMRHTLVVGTLVLALLGAAHGDTLTLRSGGTLTGRILTETDREVVMEVAGLGRMTVPRGNILDIRMGDDPAPPEPGPTPSPPKPAPPGSKPAPAPREPEASTPLSKRIDFSVKAGPLPAALANLATAAGISIDLTHRARTLSGEQDLRTRAFSREESVEWWLRSLVEHASGMMLKWTFEEGRILVGLPREVKGAAAVNRGTGIEWPDPTGDTSSAFDPPGWIRPDLFAVGLQGRDGRLLITLRFDRTLEQILTRRTPEGTMKGYDLVEVYLDVDGNEGTGQALSWDEERKGWEYRLTVSTGFAAKDDTGNCFTQWGNVETVAGVHTVERVLVTHTLHKEGFGTAPVPEGDDCGTPEKRTSLDDRQIVVSVPYGHLGVRAGAKIRVVWVDCLEGLLSDDRLSKTGALELR